MFWFGWNFALVFTFWLFAFVGMAIKDKLVQRRSKGAPSLMSNMYIKLGVFFIVLIVLIFVVIIPLIGYIELAFACKCNPFA